MTPFERYLVRMSLDEGVLALCATVLLGIRADARRGLRAHIWAMRIRRRSRFAVPADQAIAAAEHLS